MQLEEDCERLEEKLQIAVQEQKKLSEYQTELDDAKLKIAQIEISQESWKKKYEKISNERKDLLTKISKLDLELLNLKRISKMEDSDDVKLKIARFQMENETLKNQYENVLSERNTCKEKISELETELFDTKKKVSNLEGRLRRSEITLNSKSELEKELSRYKDLVTQLPKLNSSKEGRTNESTLEQRTRQLEQDLRGKDEKLSRLLKDFEKIKSERDQQVMKLQNQAKQFEQYVKSQNKVSAELNLSPRSMSDSTDFQKMRENIAKEMREEMEQRVAKELRCIGEQHLEERRELEEKYKTVVSEWQTKYNERHQEAETLRKAIIAEKLKISQVVGNQLEVYNRELQARKLQIEKLEADLKKKEDEVEEDRNWMAQMMTGWASELKESKAKEAEQDGEIQELKSNEEKLSSDIKILRDKEKHMKGNIDLLKHKYQRAKQSVYKYKVKYIQGETIDSPIISFRSKDASRKM